MRLLAQRHAQRRYGGGSRLFCCFGPWRLLGGQWQRQQQQQQQQGQRQQQHQQQQRFLSSRASLWSYGLQGIGREQQRQQQIQPVKLAYDFYEPPPPTPTPTSSPEPSAAAAAAATASQPYSLRHGADQGGKKTLFFVILWRFFLLLRIRLSCLAIFRPSWVKFSAFGVCFYHILLPFFGKKGAEFFFLSFLDNRLLSPYVTSHGESRSLASV
jgi:type II secretory pathway pseudopilin PulG